MSDLSPFIRKIVQRFSFFAIHNMGLFIAGLAVAGFVANLAMPVPIERFYLDPEMVLHHGQWWRLFTFAFTSGMTHPLWLLFFCLYIYFVCNALENTIGAAALTFYVFLGYLSLLGISFITYAPLDLSFYFVEYLTLAFATLFPEYELNLYGIIPVKAKWFGYLAAGLIGWQFLMGGLLAKLALPIVFLPYVLFFYPKIKYTLKRAMKK